MLFCFCILVAAIPVYGPRLCVISGQFGIIFGSSSAGSILIIICVAGYLSLVDIFIYMVNNVIISIGDCQMRWKNEMSALFVYGLWGDVHV